MKVVFTAAAKADLEAITEYIAADNPRRALTFIRELRERCLRLSDEALAFPLTPKFERFGVRRRIHGAYLIFYRAGPKDVEILHILHGARDYGRLLFPEG